MYGTATILINCANSTKELNVLVEVIGYKKGREKIALFALQTCILPFPWISPWIFLGKTGRIIVKKSSQAGRSISPKKIPFFCRRPFLGMRIDEAAAV